MTWPLYPRKEIVHTLYRKLGGPQGRGNGCGKSRLSGIRSPDRPARSESLYRLFFVFSLYFYPYFSVLIVMYFAFFSLLCNIHKTQTSMLASGIRTRNPTKQAVADPRFRLLGHWNRLRLSYPGPLIAIQMLKEKVSTLM